VSSAGLGFFLDPTPALCAGLLNIVALRPVLGFPGKVLRGKLLPAGVALVEHIADLAGQIVHRKRLLQHRSGLPRGFAA
jgi:hypothetical protein